MASISACTGDEPRVAKAMTPSTRGDSGIVPLPAFSLGRAAGGASGHAYAVNATQATGTLAGTVKGTGSKTDTSIVPTHDLRTCQRFSEPLYPTQDGGVGGAVVWISGIASGRENDVPRRVTMTMEDCRLAPRVMAVAAGGTVILNSHDAISLRLRFLDMEARDSVRATVAMTDEGQVVPLSDATRTPGIVAVRDDLHPWVRAYLAVAPHPYVAVTEGSGQFSFEGVPPGSYTLVVWHERFGFSSQPITITAGQGARADVQLR